MAEAPRRGLGRGISALMEESDPAPVRLDGSASVAGDATPAGDPREAPIELLRRNPDQPRRTFDEAELEELAASVREKGVLQPILVRPAPGADGEWQIVAGERRWRAAQRAGLHLVPIVVRRDFSDLDVLEVGIVENVQRADLDPLEEAAGYKALMDRFGRTQDAVAQVVGKSRSYVANALRLMTLPASIQAHVTAGRLTGGHARALVGAADAERLADQAVAKGLTVRQVEELARETDAGKSARSRTSKPGAASKPPAQKDSDLKALEADLSTHLGMQVEIDDKSGAGEIRIRYRNLDQLDDLLVRLSG
ncbi:ParB/RepB/Spo0J family partition protein [soil metagenome]